MGQDVNLGKALHHHMQHMANSSAALAFPSTITAMALQVRVLFDNDEETTYSQDPLDNTAIDYVLRRAPSLPAIPENP